MNESSGDIGSEWADPDDVPELDDDWFERADHYRNGVLVRAGRQPDASENSVTLASDIIDAFKATGPGWQVKVNDALREWLHLKAA